MASSRKSAKEEKALAEDPVEQSHLIDTSNMTYEDLVALQAQVAKGIALQKEKKLDEFREEFKAKASSMGFTMEEIFGIPSGDAAPVKTRNKRSDAGIKQEPYYRNPNDPSQTAFRKGKKPAWLQELIDQGVDLESLQIK